MSVTTSGADHESPLQSDVGTVDDAAAFREAADTAPVLIWMSGQDSLCTYFNSTWLGFTGRTLEQELGTGWRAGVHPDDLEQCIETYSSSFDARRPFVMEYRLRRRDGEYRWILDHGMPRFDSNGAFLGFMGSCLDITERKRLEWEQAVLLDASRLLNSSLDYEETLQHIARLAIGNLADVCLVDIIGDDSPARGVAVAHRDPDLEERLRTIRRQHPPSIERLDPMVRRVLSEGRPLVVNELPEEVLRRSYQNPEMQRVILDILPRHLLCVPLHVRGVTIGAISFGATTRGRYRRADVVFAEELARRCATAIDNARLYRDAQRRADLLSDIAAASRAFAEAGLDPDTLLEMVARRIGALTGDGCILRLDTDDEVVSDAVAVWHPDPEAARMVLEIVTGDGPNPWERLPGTVLRSGEPLLLTASPGEDLSAQVSPVFRPYVERFHVTGLLILPLTVRGRIIGTLSLAREGDRPAYSALERAFRHSLADRAALSIDNALHFAGERAARAEAEAANRTKDEFLSVLSHELRTPLTPIIGQTQLMLRRPDLPSVVSDGLKTIDRNARMQARLVEDLLDVSRIVTGKLSIERQVVPLDAVVESALDSIRSVAAEKQINLVVTIEPHAPVLGDPHRLRQIVSNLLSNAVKFTPPGGTVTASLGMGDGMARIAVSDTGIGIKRDFLPKVFDRFRQADASSTRGYAGLGLGLSIVSHLVELHGGEVRASSGGIGQGATFTVLLPPATGVVDGESPLDDSGVAGLSGARVLVVEDDPDTRELLRMILESEGARVTTAGSAAEAMDAIGQVRPTLILADIGLPSEDGYALIRKIRALPDDTGGSTPAVALTAYAGSDDRRRALAAGFDGHLAKPIEPDVLIATLVTLAPQPSAGASALS